MQALIYYVSFPILSLIRVVDDARNTKLNWILRKFLNTFEPVQVRIGSESFLVVIEDYFKKPASSELIYCQSDGLGDKRKVIKGEHTATSLPADQRIRDVV